MSAQGLAVKLGASLVEAEELLRLHRRCYPKFWEWSQGASDYGQLYDRLHTRFGWQLHVTRNTKYRTLRNFPSQGNGAEMMRLAAIHATEAGIRVCAPVHDAFLIEAAIDDIEHEVARMKECMARASADVLDGFRLGTDAGIACCPGRFGKPGKDPMWCAAMHIIDQLDPCPPGKGTPARAGRPV